jgi:putative transposase
MQQATENSHLSIWAYALMDNHVHFVAIPHRLDSLGKGIKEAHEAYTKYFNTKYGLVGHAWQDRFKSFPMDWEYCLNAIRYVERNPVRAGMVNKAEDYLWSSAAAHCGLRDDMLLSDDCPLVTEIANWSEWLSVENPNEIEHAIRRHTRIGRPLGPTEFLVSAESKTGRKLLPRKRGPRSKSNLMSTDADETERPQSLFG